MAILLASGLHSFIGKVHHIWITVCFVKLTATDKAKQFESAEGVKLKVKLKVNCMNTQFKKKFLNQHPNINNSNMKVFHFFAFCFSCFLFSFFLGGVSCPVHAGKYSDINYYSSSYRCFHTIVKKMSLELFV